MTKFARKTTDQVLAAFAGELRDAIARVCDKLDISGSVLGSYDMYEAVLKAVLTGHRKAQGRAV